jgi:hypothetical protein
MAITEYFKVLPWQLPGGTDKKNDKLTYDGRYPAQDSNQTPLECKRERSEHLKTHR